MSNAESTAKFYQQCSLSHSSAVLDFLKAKVGYRKGDAGWQLAQSDPGLRFLSLAACLITSDRWTASEAPYQLIIDIAS